MTTDGSSMNTEESVLLRQLPSEGWNFLLCLISFINIFYPITPEFLMLTLLSLDLDRSVAANRGVSQK